MLTEKETLQRAKLYLLKLKMGIDPITDKPVDETTLHNERLLKCFTYICSALDKQIAAMDQASVKPERKTGTSYHRKPPFAITEEQKQQIQLSGQDCLSSELTQAINDAVDDKSRRKLLVKNINGWLEDQGYMKKITDQQGKEHRDIGERAAEIGLTSKTGMGAYGEYPIVMFSEQAQQFVLEHIEEIVAFAEKEEG